MGADTGEFRQIAIDVARLQERLARMEDDVKAIRGQQSTILEQMNRWRGAAPAYLAIGGLIATAITQWEKLKHLIKS